MWIFSDPKNSVVICNQIKCHSSIQTSSFNHSPRSAISSKPLRTNFYVIFILTYSVVATWVDDELWGLELSFCKEIIFNISIIVNCYTSAMFDIGPCFNLEFLGSILIFKNLDLGRSVIFRAKWSIPCVSDPTVNGAKILNTKLFLLRYSRWTINMPM